MSSSIKDDIVAAIAKTDDNNMKVVLLLMLGIVSEIGDKIEMWQRDEKGLRDAVLNGHEPVHHDHHEWISKKIKEEEEELAASKESKRTIRDGLIEKIIWTVVVLIAGSGWVIK